MSVENMLPQGSNRMTTTVTPTTSSQTVAPTAGYLFSSVTVNAIPNLTATRLYSGTTNTYTTNTAYRYLVAVCTYWNSSGAQSFTYSGTATSMVNNYHTSNDNEQFHVTILRNASSGVKFTSGQESNAGRFMMIVYGFNY